MLDSTKKRIDGGDITYLHFLYINQGPIYKGLQGIEITNCMTQSEIESFLKSSTCYHISKNTPSRLLPGWWIYSTLVLSSQFQDDWSMYPSLFSMISIKYKYVWIDEKYTMPYENM